MKRNRLKELVVDQQILKYREKGFWEIATAVDSPVVLEELWFCDLVLHGGIVKVGVQHNHWECQHVGGVRRGKGPWVVLVIPRGKDLHNAVNLLGLARKPEARQEFSERAFGKTFSPFQGERSGVGSSHLRALSKESPVKSSILVYSLSTSRLKGLLSPKYSPMAFLSKNSVSIRKFATDSLVCSSRPFSTRNSIPFCIQKHNTKDKKELTAKKQERKEKKNVDTDLLVWNIEFLLALDDHLLLFFTIKVSGFTSREQGGQERRKNEIEKKLMKKFMKN